MILEHLRLCRSRRELELIHGIKVQWEGAMVALGHTWDAGVVPDPMEQHGNAADGAGFSLMDLTRCCVFAALGYGWQQ